MNANFPLFRLVGLLACLAFGAAAHAQSCERTTTLAEVSDGLSLAASGTPSLPLESTTTLSLEYSGCEPLESLDIHLPDELRLVQYPDFCEATSTGLTCSPPNRAGRLRGGADHRIDYAVEAVLNGHQLNGMDEGSGEYLVAWSATGWLASPDRGGVARVDVEGEYSILASGFVQLGPPAGFTYGPIPPGASLPMVFQANHGGALSYGITFPAGTYGSHEVYTGDDLLCGGGGGSFSCSTPAAPHEIDGRVIWTVPTTPGTYTGQVNAQACIVELDPATCGYASSTFTVIVAEEETEANVTVTKSGPVEAQVGMPFDWTITITNAGPDPAENFQLIDALPDGVTFQSVSASNGSQLSCSGAGNVVSCFASSLPVGTHTVAITVTGDELSDGVDEFIAVNSCAGQVTADNGSPDADNCENSVRIYEGNPPATVALSKSGPPTVQPGAGFDWTITVDSQGPDPAENFVLTDELPAGVIFNNVTATGPLNCSVDSGTVTCTASSLPLGSYTVTISVTAPASIPSDGLINTCTGSVAGEGIVQDAACTHIVGGEAGPGDPDPPVYVYTDLAPFVGGPISAAAGEEFTVTFNTFRVDGSSSFARMRTTGHGAGFRNYGDLEYVSHHRPAGWNGAAGCHTPTFVPQSLQCHSTGFVGTPSSPNWDPVSYTFRVNDNPGAANPEWCIRSEPRSWYSGDDLQAPIDTNQDNDLHCHEVITYRSTDLSITKTGPTSPVLAGSQFSYNLSVSNAGPSNATGVTVVDTLPVGMAFDSPGYSGSGWSCSFTGRTASCSRSGSVGPTSLPALTLHVIAPNEGGAYNNCATVSSNESDPSTGNNTDCHLVDVEPIADLAVLVGGPEFAYAGSDYSQTLSVTNLGPSTATGITLSESLSPGTNYTGFEGTGWSCSESGGTVNCGHPNSLAMGGHLPTLQFNFTAPNEANTLDLCGLVSGDQSDPVPGNNAACHETEIRPMADLGISLTGPDSAQASDSVTWELHLSNDGPSSPGSIEVTGALPPTAHDTSIAGGGAWNCAIAGSEFSCSGSAHSIAVPIYISMTAPNEADTLNGCATVSGQATDPDHSNNEACHVTDVTPHSTVDVTKTAPAEVVAGANFAFKITVENHGPSSAPLSVLIDNLPADVTFLSVVNLDGLACQMNVDETQLLCPAQNLAPGSYDVDVIVTAPDEAGVVTNICHTNFGSTGNVTVNDQCEVTTTIRASADLDISKSVLNPPVLAGQEFQYSIVVDNLGPSTAQNVVVTDDLPEGVTFVSVDAPGFSCSENNDTVTCTASSLPVGVRSITITAIAPDEPGPISNVCVIATDTDDPNPIGPDDCRSDDIVHPAAIIEVSKSSSPNPAFLNQPLTYTITVDNLGPNEAQNVSVEDALPDDVTFVGVTATDPLLCGELGGLVACSADSLPVGQYIIDIEVIPTALGDLMNVCVVDSDTANPFPPDPEDCEDHSSVLPVADLSVEKTASVSSVYVGHDYYYTITVTNDGPNGAHSFLLTDTLPAGVILNGFQYGEGVLECSASGGVVECEVPSGSGGQIEPILPVGTHHVIMEVTAPMAPGMIYNTCEIESGSHDPTPIEPGDCADAGVNVLPIADLSVSKSSPDEVLVNAPYTYTITVINDGPNAAQRVEIYDDLPAGVTYLGATSASFDCEYGAGQVSCYAETLSTDRPHTIDIEVTAPSSPGVIHNTCVVDSGVYDPTPPTPEDCHDGGVDVQPVADLVVSKSSTPNPVLAGQPLSYLIHLDNLGPQPAENVTVADEVPAGVTIQSVSGGALDCAVSGNLVECSTAVLPVGSYVIQIDGTAPLVPGLITNTCVVGTDTHDPTPILPGDCQDGNDVQPAADLSVVKAASVESVPAGQPYSYQIVVTNEGPNEAENVEVSDDLPLGVEVDGPGTWTDGAFDCSASGGTVTCLADELALGVHAITINVIAPLETGSITNVCVVESDTGDPTPIQPGDCQDDGVEVLPSADIEVVKTVSAPEVLTGQPFSYTLTVSNLGPTESESVQISDTLPAGLTFLSVEADAPFACTETGGVVACEADSLEVGDYDITIHVRAPLEPMELTNTCVAISESHDPNPGGDGGVEFCEDVPVDIVPSAELEIGKSVTTSPVLAGQPFTYQIEATNLGPNEAENVEISDPLPAGVTFESASAPAEFVCSEAAGTVTCTAATLPVGGPYLIDLNVIAPDEAGPITNVCVIESDTGDPTPPTPADCQDDSEVEPAADLQFAKTVHSLSGTPVTEVDAGTTFLWRVAVTNLGPSPAEGIEITDAVPADFPVQDVTGYTSSGDNLICATDATTNTVTCSLDELPVDAIATMDIEVLAPDQAGQFTNVCTHEADTADPNPSTCEGDVIVQAVADMQVTLAAYDDPDAYLIDPASQTPVHELEAGAEGLYVATVTNAGPSDAEGVDLITDLDAAFSGLMTAGDSATDCGLSDQTLACAFGDMAVGTSRTAVVRMTAPELDISLTTTAEVSSTTKDDDLANNTASHTLHAQESPVIGLAKTQTANEHAGSGEFVSSILLTVINYGNVPLSNVQITDDFSDAFPASVPWVIDGVEVTGGLSETNPAFDGVTDLNLLSGTETLPVNGEAFVKVSFRFTPGVEPGPFWNSAEATGLSTLDIEVSDVSTDGVDPNPGNTHPGDYDDPTPIGYDESPMIGLAKWVVDRVYDTDPSSQIITIGIQVENWGDVPLGSVQVTDDLVSAFTPQSIIDEHGRLAVASGIQSDWTAFDSVANWQVSGDLSEINPAFDGVNDLRLLSGMETLPVGGQALITFDVMIEPGDQHGPFHNRAIGAGSSPQGYWAEDYSQAGQDANPSGSGDPTDDNEATIIYALHADLATSKVTATPNAGVGERVTWEVTLTNLGPDTAAEVYLYDEIPPEATFESMEQISGPAFTCGITSAGGAPGCWSEWMDAGEEAVFEVHTTAPMTVLNLVNHCSLEATSPDPDHDNNSHEICVAEHYLGERAALSIDKVAITPVILAGERLEYLIVVTNDGPNAASDVVVTDVLPPGAVFQDVVADAPFVCSESSGAVTCEADALPMGVHAITIGVLAPNAAGPITNACVLDSGTVNPTPVDPEDCTDVSDVEPAANLIVTKQATTSQVGTGATFSYLIEVENLGPSPAEQVTISDPLADGLELVNVQADSPWVCAMDAGVATCQADTLPVGTYVIEVVVTAPSVAGQVQNVCVLDTATANPSAAMVNCESAPVDVVPANVSMSKQAVPASVAPGDTFNWVITIHQAGPGDVHGLVLQDDVPPPSVVLGVSGDDPLSCTQSGNLASCSADVLPPGTYQMVVQTQAPTTAGPIANTCVAESSSGLSVQAEECGGVVEVQELTTLNVTVLTDQAWVDVGDEWTYTVEVRNDGLLMASGIELNLSHDGPATPIEAAASNGALGGSACWTGLAANGQGKCPHPALAPGDSTIMHLPMRADRAGRHSLTAHAVTTTPLTADSQLRGQAGVNIGRGDGLPDAVPIPTMGVWGRWSLIFLMIVCGVFALRTVGIRSAE